MSHFCFEDVGIISNIIPLNVYNKNKDSGYRFGLLFYDKLLIYLGW